MKTALITYKKTLKHETIKDLKRKLNYEKYFIITQKTSFDIANYEKDRKVKIIVCPYKNIISQIDEIIAKYGKEYSIYPYFVGDANSKLAIRTYNKLFGTKINPNNFKIKNKMNDFLGQELACKKSYKLSYKDISELSFDKLKKKVGQPFILKPINAASSLLNFKISSASEFEKAKKIFKKKYDYVIEEYLEGNLYSLDFFCDGQDIFLLCFCRAMSFLELLENFSDKYLEKYQSHLSAEFLHFLPIRYTLNLKKMSPLELDFVRKIGRRLTEEKYRGFIHLEYKVKRKEEKIGFIEWGARTGGKRAEFIEGMHGLKVENLPLEIIHRKDFGRFEKSKGLYFLKNKDVDKNFAMVYTSVLEKTHVMKLLSKIPSYLNVSYESFLKSYLWDTWKIRVKNIVFFLLTNPEGYIYPFYERSDTKLNYILEFEEESFRRFVKNKHKILEHLVFHDYKQK